MIQINNSDELKRVTGIVYEKVIGNLCKPVNSILSSLSNIHKSYPQFFNNLSLQFEYFQYFIENGKGSELQFLPRTFFGFTLSSWLLTKQCITINQKDFSLNTPRTYCFNTRFVRRNSGKIFYLCNTSSSFPEYNGFFIFIDSNHQSEGLTIYVIADMKTPHPWTIEYMGMEIFSLTFEKSISIQSQAIPSLYTTDWSEKDTNFKVYLLIARLVEYLGSDNIEPTMWRKYYDEILDSKKDSSSPFSESQSGDIFNFNISKLSSKNITKKINLLDNFHSDNLSFDKCWIDPFRRFESYNGELKFDPISIITCLQKINNSLMFCSEHYQNPSFRGFLIYTILVKDLLRSLEKTNNGSAIRIRYLCKAFELFEYMRTSHIRHFLKSIKYPHLKDTVDSASKCAFTIKKTFKAANLSNWTIGSLSMEIGNGDVDKLESDIISLKKRHFEVYSIIGRTAINVIDFRTIALTTLKVLAIIAAQSDSEPELESVKKTYCVLLSASCQISIRQTIDMESLYIIISFLDQWKDVIHDSNIQTTINLLTRFGNLGYKHNPSRQDVFIPSGLMPFSLKDTVASI